MATEVVLLRGNKVKIGLKNPQNIQEGQFDNFVLPCGLPLAAPYCRGSDCFAVPDYASISLRINPVRVNNNCAFSFVGLAATGKQFSMELSEMTLFAQSSINSQ
jgi:hypothetical protein